MVSGEELVERGRLEKIRKPKSGEGKPTQVWSPNFLGRLHDLLQIAFDWRERGHQETFRRLGPFFTQERLGQLDQVLVREEQLGRTPLAWLGERAANTSKAIVAELKKLDFLRELGVTEWGLSTINPNRLKFLAQIGRRATSQALQRLAPARRYPIVAAFLRHSMSPRRTVGQSWPEMVSADVDPIKAAFGETKIQLLHHQEQARSTT
jgi:hypothetical protein